MVALEGFAGCWAGCLYNRETSLPRRYSSSMSKAFRAVRRVVIANESAALAALSEAGFIPLGRCESNVPAGMIAVGVEVLGDHDGDAQRAVLASVEQALSTAGIHSEAHGHSVVIGGGSANDRWSDVTIDGESTGARVLVGPSEDHQSALSELAGRLGVDVDRLEIAAADSTPPNS